MSKKTDNARNRSLRRMVRRFLCALGIHERVILFTVPPPFEIDEPSPNAGGFGKQIACLGCVHCSRRWAAIGGDLPIKWELLYSPEDERMMRINEKRGTM